jgi:hypothetical protein
MKPLSIPFAQLSRSIAGSEFSQVSEKECWTDETFSFGLTAEEIINLVALGREYPNLRASNKDLDEAINVVGAGANEAYRKMRCAEDNLNVGLTAEGKRRS